MSCRTSLTAATTSTQQPPPRKQRPPRPPLTAAAAHSNSSFSLELAIFRLTGRTVHFSLLVLHSFLTFQWAIH
ncbi:hypothetical protein BDZ91DRAFT_458311 [Kalaharituber pfeilii]|nr:hypothetical protein BDZ91DRAFT_458311 [Kalaharituber pfeilii]